MKNLLMIVVISIIGISAATAQIGKIQAKNCINKSNEILFKARDEVKIHKVFTGDLTKALIHQRFAVKQYKENHFVKAFFHAVSARYYANLAINKNTGQIRMFIVTLSEAEKDLIVNNPELSYWQPSKSGQEQQHYNQTFIDVAVHESRRKELDHVGPFPNNDNILINDNTQFENLQPQY
ncbi:MAG: hypothetical protein C0592_04885 [Marinilabiliales bacterium]|nr:MAG: hypothetical protein C0592_04885 [Marinilabiliales bacterium]